MPNLKQRLIKAGTDFNYAEGMKVKAAAGVTITANQIVYANGYEGPFVIVALADATDLETCSGRLMIAKHDIPAGEYGVVLPWKLVTGLDTNGLTVGNPVFLSETPGGWQGTAPGGGAQSVIVGSVLTADDTTGGVLFCTDMGKA